MARNFTDEQIDELAHHLQGTCMSLNDGLDQCFDKTEDDMTLDDCHALDDKVFMCVKCEWWHEMGEMSDDEKHDWECEECANET